MVSLEFSIGVAGSWSPRTAAQGGTNLLARASRNGREIGAGTVETEIKYTLGRPGLIIPSRRSTCLPSLA